MAKYQAIFKRYEKKYLITQRDRERLLSIIGDRLCDDEFGKSTICNLYFDTPNYAVIRSSMEGGVFKEKLRLRCYGIPQRDSHAFVELKKKFKGVVYKRRIYMSYEDAVTFLCKRDFSVARGQVSNEILYFMDFYKGLRPSMSIFSDRIAYFAKENRELRITFDDNIRFRSRLLDLSRGAFGTPIISDDLCVMEIKTDSSVPLWLSQVLDELKLFPTPFSKYKKAYEMLFNSPLLVTAMKN